MLTAMTSTFVMGLLALITWLLAIKDIQLAMRLLGVGLAYSILASALNLAPFLFGGAVGLSDRYWWNLIAAALLTPIVEELIKSHAARSQTRATQSFALVCTFGIFELMLSKPLIMSAQSGMDGLFEALVALPSLFVHVLTGIIYAFCFTGQRTKQLVVCICIHASFNGLVFASHSDSVIFVAGGAAVIACILFFPWRGIATPNESQLR